MSVSDRRSQRGKVTHKYRAEKDSEEHMAEAHYSTLSYNEAILCADKEIFKLNKSIKKCDEISARSQRVKETSRQLDKMMAEFMKAI